MSVVRAWTRQLYGASGAALLVPGAIALALVLLAVAGGFGRLGDLSQAFAGPSAPPSVSLPDALAVRGAGPVLPVATTAATATTAAARPGATATGGGRARGGGDHVNRSPGAGTVPLATTGPGSGSSGTGSSGTSTGGGQPPAGSGSEPTLIDGVVSVGTSVTSQLPGPAGGVATGLLQSLGKGVDSILPGTGASSTVAGASSTVAGTVKTLLPGLPLP